MRTADLSPHPENMRSHNARSVDAIARSLARFGQQKPIVVDRDHRVLAGNGTLEAARSLGWTEIDTVGSSLATAEAMAYLIADNRTADLSEWNNKALREMLGDMDADVRAAIGFDENEYDELLFAIQHGFANKLMRVDDLKPHPRNYREHPDDQLQHIIASITQHGFYRNIVVSSDKFILAGHGVVAAARKMGTAMVPTIQLEVPHDDPRALKIMASDNEISNLAAVDDRALTEMLKEIMAMDEIGGLEGTGFDKQQLAALTMTTRPASEIQSHDHAAEWVGMPSYQDGAPYCQIVVKFATEADRAEFNEKFLDGKAFGSQTERQKKSWGIWWPRREQQTSRASVVIEDEQP